VEEFELLLAVFRQKYANLFTLEMTRQGTPRQRREGGGVKEKLLTDEDKLLFILVYQKTYPLQTKHGLQFGLSQPQTNYWIHRLLPVLRESLAEMGMAPERDPQKVADSPLVNETAPDLLIDGADRRASVPKTSTNRKIATAARKKRIPTRISCWSTAILARWPI
jgi:hypothetical protein